MSKSNKSDEAQEAFALAAKVSSDDQRIADLIEKYANVQLADTGQLSLQNARKTVIKDADKLSEYQKRDALKTERLKSDNTLSRRLAYWSLGLVSALLLFTILFITWYLWFAFYRHPEKLDSAILITWMTSTVVEVIGIVYIIARYLFPSATAPRKDSSEPSE